MYGLLAVLVVILLVSVFVNFKLLHHAKKYYLRYNITCIDPLGTRYYPAAAPAERRDRSRPRIMFYGDSRSVGWIPPTIEGVEFVNRGISGQTTAQVLSRFDLHAAPLAPDLAILQVGINDLKTIPLFPGRRDLTVNNCREGIAELVARFQEIGADVIVTTIFPNSSVPIERKPFWSPAIGEAVEEVNQFIRGMDADGVEVLDAHALLNDREEVRRDFAQDTLHLNPAGYHALNRELVPLIYKWLRSRDHHVPGPHIDLLEGSDLRRMGGIAH